MSLTALPILFCGWACTKAHFNPAIHFKEGFICINKVNNISAISRMLMSIKRPLHLIGLSLGAHYALQVADHLQSTHTLKINLISFRPNYTKEEIHLASQALKKHSDSYLRFFFRRAIPTKAALSTASSCITESLKTMDTPRLLSDLTLLANNKSIELLENLIIPVSFTHDINDKIAPFSEIKPVIRNIDHIHTHSCGHIPFFHKDFQCA